MSGERHAEVLARLTDHAAYRGVATPSEAACEASVALLGVSGAQLTLRRGTGRNAYSYATNQIGTLLESMRFVLGEGPCEHSLRSGVPVLVRDLDSWDNHQRWPLFALSARATGARAVFAFPLRSGAIHLGALVLHRTSPGPLTSEQVADAHVVTDIVMSLVLDELTRVHAEGPPPEGMPLRRAEVHQATGMLSVQLGVSMDEALVRLRAHSFAHDKPVVEVARDVVTRRLRLSPDDRFDLR
ncbi:GAF domain-containing protein [Lentzea waywayandensis]|uniref:GAF domain-containing protein n=1 Tax=Lentzea waywayandensis TaxID=84724 RepID=A0A1I6FDL9_9PSEU|nr:GAF and ANTAR domain-containing protein [Lentzea waywayandensis]SFR27953.1 GAF domain-containing protein [Lentzea waywayandensis]